MPFRIEVQSAILDARGKVKKRQFEALGLKNKIGAVYVLDCYTIDARLNKKQIQKAAELLVNPLVEEYTIASGIRNQELGIRKIKFDYAIEISFLPGVTDNVGNTAKETLEDGLRIKFKPRQKIYSSQVYFISGKLSKDDIGKIADSLYNPLIQKAAIKTYLQFTGDGGFGFNLPKVKLTSNQKVITIDLNVPNKELVELGKLGILDPKGLRRGPLSLSLDYLKTIRTYFNKLGRNPTDVELESLAQTWSEHCIHTIFQSPIDDIKKGLFKHYIQRATEIVRKKKASEAKPRRGTHRVHSTGGDFCMSVFKDNSGGIVFDDHYLITHKVETHNTPSALDPFGGAITGIVGVNRDCLGFGLGAKPVVNVYGFCLAPVNDETVLYRDAAKRNKMLSAQRIMEGTIAGVNAGGNQSGIPTNNGFLYFDSRFRGKPLVFCGTVGLIPKNIGGRPGHIKQAQNGDLIVMVGGRVGLDGIHGATFSSESLAAHSPATAVQIGDPITQKKFSDAIIKEARSLNLYNSITDCGAGGLSSAVGEMAKESGGNAGRSSSPAQRGGCEVFLDKVPVKYPGLAPWQIWISESQERMVLAVPPTKWKKIYALMKNRGVEATVIGHFTNSGKCVVRFKKQIVMDIDLNFLHGGLPKKQLRTRAVKFHPPPASSIKGTEKNLNSDILAMISRPNLASSEFISQQYDHEVQGGSVLKPLQGRGRINSDTTITKPVLDSPKAVCLSSALFPSYSELDPYKMAACCIDTAIRQAVATGADVDYLALLDNFCWCSSQDPKRLWQLKEAAKACFDYATRFGTPFISGKDSMFNDFQGFDKQGKPIKISIPPTLLISAIGVVPDATKTVSLDAKIPGDLIYVLGETNNELGGSEYMQMIYNSPPNIGGVSRTKLRDGVVPKVNATKNLKLYHCLFQAIQKDLVASAISISRGGLVIALAKTLMAGNLGANIRLQNLPGKWKENYEALFSESMGRILITIALNNKEKFERQMRGNIFGCIGKVINHKELNIKDKNNKIIVELNIASALNAYKSTFKDF